MSARAFKVEAKGSRSGEIIIYDDIGAGMFGGGVTAKQVRDDLNNLGNVARLSVRLNSLGGDVFDGVAIHRAIAEHPARTTVHVDGVAASAASIIAMAGDEIHIAEAGFMMIHNPWSMAVGPASEMRATADRLDAIRDQMVEVYQRRTRQDRKDIQEMLDAETWISAADSVAMGFATQIAPNVAMAAYADPAKYFSNVPECLRQAANDAPVDLARVQAGKSRLKEMQSVVAALR